MFLIWMELINQPLKMNLKKEITEMLYVDVEVTSFKDNDGKYANSIN